MEERCSRQMQTEIHQRHKSDKTRQIRKFGRCGWAIMQDVRTSPLNMLYSLGKLSSPPVLLERRDILLSYNPLKLHMLMYLNL